LTSSLLDSSVTRAALPPFPGATLRDQLVAGMTQAGQILGRYAPGPLDRQKLTEAVHRVQQWQQTNHDALLMAMQPGQPENLPTQIQLQMSTDIAQSYVLGTFVIAAQGLGPWVSGQVSAEIQKGVLMTNAWAQDDASERLKVFGSIVKMEQDGYLAELFAPVQATSGFGALALIEVIAIAVVAIASVWIVMHYAANVLENNNEIAKQACLGAKKEGQPDHCNDILDYLKGNGFLPSGQNIASSLTTVAIAIGIGWLVMSFGPKFLEQILDIRDQRATKRLPA